MIGENIAHFEITAKIGEGGMGEVYQATDTKLNREVALKVLPESFAQDPQRMGRFQREAQVLASLNHPNIAAIYGLESVSEPRREGLESRSLEVSWSWGLRPVTWCLHSCTACPAATLRAKRTCRAVARRGKADARSSVKSIYRHQRHKGGLAPGT